jgi:hypothetical protein
MEESLMAEEYRGGRVITIAAKLGSTNKKVMGVYTNLAASRGEDWKVTADMAHPDSDHVCVAPLTRDNKGRPQATLRRVGWLDQKGRVWTETPATYDFDGGSLIPLLVDPGERV